MEALFEPIKDKQLHPIQNIEIGETIIYDDSLFLKIEIVNDLITAANIETGEVKYFDGEENVEIVDCAIQVIR